MALTYEQFLEMSGCEVVCGNLIVGIQSTRKVVGSVLDGTFNLNEDGLALAAELEAAATADKPARRTKKADEAAPAADAA
jgi:hypothetical protein